MKLEGAELLGISEYSPPSMFHCAPSPKASVTPVWNRLKALSVWPKRTKPASGVPR